MTYEIIPPFAPRIAEYRDLPDRSTPLMAQEMNGWNDRLALLTDAVNSAGSEANNAKGAAGVIAETAPKGTLLVSDGTRYVPMAPGAEYDVLSPSPNASTGLAWAALKGAEVSRGPSHVVTLTGSTAIPKWATVALYPTLRLYRSFSVIDPSKSFVCMAWESQTPSVSDRHIRYSGLNGTTTVQSFTYLDGESYSWTMATLPPELRPQAERRLTHSNNVEVMGGGQFTFTVTIGTDGVMTGKLTSTASGSRGQAAAYFRINPDVSLWQI